MRYYIATGLERCEEHNLLRDRLPLDWFITYDWTVHGSVQELGPNVIRNVSVAEARGVLGADLVIVLLPGGRGTHAELGMAIAAGKPVIVHSESAAAFEIDTCAFYFHPLVQRVVCPAGAIAQAVTHQSTLVGS